MTEILLFLFGMIVGVTGAYFFMRNQQTRDRHGVADHVEKQKIEKQSRKKEILRIIGEKGSVTNNDIETALGVSDASVTNYLQELEREGKIEQIGERGRFVSYKGV